MLLETTRFSAFFLGYLRVFGVKVLVTFVAAVRPLSGATFGVTFALGFFNLFRVLAISFRHLDTHQSYALNNPVYLEASLTLMLASITLNRSNSLSPLLVRSLNIS